MLYMVPEMVWNAVNLDNSPTRVPGELPHSLTTKNKLFPKNLPPELMPLLKFWVLRKDTFFSEHKWTIVVEIYENLKKEVIVRVKVHQREGVKYPHKWMNKGEGEVVSFP